MSDQEINIAIAESCGWVNCIFPSQDDYCNDLNAMHKAEKTLNKEQWVTYGKELSRLNIFPMVHANARQRSEAFLKTLGK